VRTNHSNYSGDYAKKTDQRYNGQYGVTPRIVAGVNDVRGLERAEVQIVARLGNIRADRGRAAGGNLWDWPLETIQQRRLSGTEETRENRAGHSRRGREAVIRMTRGACPHRAHEWVMASTHTVTARINASSWSGSISTPYVSLTRNHFFDTVATVWPSRSISYS